MLDINSFDLNMPSKVSIQRRVQLNQMAKQAFLNTGLEEIQGRDIVIDLTQECLAMDEVFEQASGIGSYVHFYENIDSAFSALIEINPSAFRTYKELTSMFRILEKHQNTIHKKWNELRHVLVDLDVLEGEMLRGGPPCA